MTPLDFAHDALSADPENDALRLALFSRLAEAELFVLLAAEAEDDKIEPELFAYEGTTYVLAFDTEERLTGFTERPVPYVALSGRVLVSMLVPNGFGLGLNLEVAASSELMPPETLEWFAEILGEDVEAVDKQITELSAPDALPEALIEALDAKLATAQGMASAAYLALAQYSDGTQGMLLAFTGAPDAAQAALTQAVSEALAFSGLAASALDIGYFDEGAPIIEVLQRQGVRVDLPAQEEVQSLALNVGLDPDKPPKLR